jgi:probable rRNA maturation factor
MEPLVETLIEDDRWLALDLPALAERAGMAALNGAGIAPQGFALCLMACDDARIAVLNAQFRGKAAPTNVLSWPSEDRSPEIFGDPPPPPEPGDAEDPLHLGDVALAWDTCAREAQEQKKPLSDHACHLIVHGTLHLLGYDHQDDEDAALMERIEISALATLGIANPY